MSSRCAESKLSSMAVTFIAGLCFAVLSCSEAFAQPHAGRVIGDIDGISQDGSGDHFFISGWACQQGQKKSIAVHLYADDPKDPSKKTLLLAQFANLYNEPSVAQACQDNAGGKHRFLILLPFGYGPESKLYVNGIRVVEGVPNDAITGSGRKLTLLPELDVPYPSLPRLSGSYHSLAEHPRVFTTATELKDLVARINRPGSYSMQRFGLLANKIKSDLSSGIDWNVTYSGCNGRIYQYAFSYEPQDGLDALIRSGLQMGPDVKAKTPAGAAVVASRLALYAALVKAGATLPAGAPSGDDAAALAKRIMLVWAEHAFPRNAQGRIWPLYSQFCNSHGGLEDTGMLSVGRGALYFVYAQDLMWSLGVFNAKEENELNAFQSGLFDLIRQSLNGFFGFINLPFPACSRYTNQPTNAIASLLAIARLMDDRNKIDAVLYGGDRSIPVLLPWVRLFDRVIYGESDSPPDCIENRFPDSLTSLENHADYFTDHVAPGEIADRFRNAKNVQGIGYPMFTLERLFDSAEILRIAGFDPYAYRGAHKQSLEMAMQYYSCYAKGAGFYQVVTAENSRSCPDAAQYYGKLVNGVDQMVLIGAYRFPNDSSITGIEAAAKATATSGGFSTDAILFGKWRD